MTQNSPSALIDAMKPQAEGKFLVTGYAVDFGSDLSTVKLRIQRLSDTTYWDGELWTHHPNTWLLAEGTSRWSLSVHLQAGSYEIVAFASDISGNVQRWADNRARRRITVESSAIDLPTSYYV